MIKSDWTGLDWIGSDRIELGAVGAHRYHRPVIHYLQQSKVNQLKATFLATIHQALSILSAR